MKRTSIESLVTTTLAIAAAAALVVAVGCGETETNTQQMTGQLSTEADEDAEEETDGTVSADADVVAVDDVGNAYLFETDDEGNFVLELPVGHTYELYVSEEGVQGLEEANKMTFPRLDGEIDPQVAVQGEMAPFDLGEVGTAESEEEADYYLMRAEEGENAEDNAQADAQDDAGDTETDEDGDDQAQECDEGAPGLYCIHDGKHPACEGLETAAENRADAPAGGADNAPGGGPPEGIDVAEQARDAAERDIEEADEAPEIPEAEAGDESGDADVEGPVALPEFNPPAVFPGCDI